MILVLKYVQKVIKTYKTLVGALTHTCTLCTHLHYPLLEKNESKTFHWPLSGKLHELNMTALFQFAKY